MPRDINGNFTLDPSNPVAPGTVIETAWANPTLVDIAAALTDSLSRSGSGGMLVPFRFADGTLAAPGISFTNEPTSGFTRVGLNDVRVSIGTQEVLKFTAAGLAIPAGKTLVVGGSVTSPFLTATNRVTTPIVQSSAGLDLVSAGTTLSVNPAGHFVDLGGDNVHDIGIFGDRFRSGRFGTSVETPLLQSPAASALIINALAGVGLLQFAGVSIAGWNATQFSPQADNAFTLGGPALRWSTGYFGTVFSPLLIAPAGAELGLGSNTGTYWKIDLGAGFIPMGDNDRDLGSAAARIKTGYFGTSVVSPLLTAPAGSPVEFSSPTGVVGPNSDATHSSGSAAKRWAAVHAVSFVGGFAPAFESAEVALLTLAAGFVNFAHGLAALPRLIRVVCRCKIAENGYAVGDEVDVFSATTQAAGISADATNVTYSQDTVPGFSIKGGGGPFTMTTANWRYVARAWI